MYWLGKYIKIIRSNSMIKIGDKVVFKNSVVVRAGHDKYIADMRGEVLEIMGYGKIAKVDCGNTFVGQDGKTVRFIPIANLQKFLSNGAIPDWT
jgi:hypothetical protein